MKDYKINTTDHFKIDTKLPTFHIIGYTVKALKEVGLGKLVNSMYEEALSGGRLTTLTTCDYYIFLANEVWEEMYGY